jgi:hypothetical protein
VPPYRAKTKGKVERFNSYLKGSFVLPLASSLGASGLRPDVDVANRDVRRWLDDAVHDLNPPPCPYIRIVTKSRDLSELGLLPEHLFAGSVGPANSSYLDRPMAGRFGCTTPSISDLPCRPHRLLFAIA